MASRLLSKLRRLQVAHEDRIRASRVMVPTGVLWTEGANRHDAPAIECGEDEDVVIDYTLLSRGEGFTIAKCSERVTRDPEDLGLIYDAAGKRIGRVLRAEGGVVELDYDEAAVPDSRGAA